MILRRVIQHVKKQEWTAIAIDFVIVVAGVFVGIQVANWNETRRDRAHERVYLARIAADLQKSVADIDNSIRRAQERQELGRLLMRAVGDEQVVRAEPGRFMAALLTGSYTFTPGIRSLAFDEMTSVGDLGLIQDKQVLDEISEYYTTIRESAQWSYIRETKQTQYMKFAAGILTHEQMTLIDATDGAPTFSVADALAARERMLERPDFIDWLPTVSYRSEDLSRYRQWRADTLVLHGRLTDHLGQARNPEAGDRNLAD